MPKMSKKNIAFVEELKSKNIFDKLPKMDDWVFGEEIKKTWHEDGLQWELRSTKMTHPEYHLYCGNWDKLLKLKITKKERQKQYIFKSCDIYLAKDFPDKVPKIIEGDYAFTYIKVVCPKPELN
jgi:hypothetical protein